MPEDTITIPKHIYNEMLKNRPGVENAGSATWEESQRTWNDGEPTITVGHDHYFKLINDITQLNMHIAWLQHQLSNTLVCPDYSKH